MSINRVILIALASLTAAVVCGISLVWMQGSRVRTVTLAAGSRAGESYIIGSALKKVVERHYGS